MAAMVAMMLRCSSVVLRAWSMGRHVMVVACLCHRRRDHRQHRRYDSHRCYWHGHGEKLEESWYLWYVWCLAIVGKTARAYVYMES
jgi:hypothetical protein